jgi:hypothetical protein
VPMRFFYAGFSFFTSKWNYCRVTGPQNKIFIKNQLTLLYIYTFKTLKKFLMSPYTRHTLSYFFLDGTTKKMRIKSKIFDFRSITTPQYEIYKIRYENEEQPVSSVSDGNAFYTGRKGPQYLMSLYL